MGKLYFFYSTMNAGKTTSLLQMEYNYRKQGINTITLLPWISNKKGIIKSRIGIKKKGIIIDEKFNIFKFIIKKNNIKYIFIDEVQFLKKKHIFQLIGISNKMNVNILTYGLRTNFKSKLFEGSKYLLAFADKIIELKTICFCGKKAIMNIKIDKNGKKILSGDQINTDKKLYISVCRKHYYEYNKNYHIK